MSTRFLPTICAKKFDIASQCRGVQPPPQPAHIVHEWKPRVSAVSQTLPSQSQPMASRKSEVRPGPMLARLSRPKVAVLSCPPATAPLPRPSAHTIGACM